MTAPRNTYLAIANDLRNKIENGTYTRELPTIGNIAMQHVVTRSVALRAVNLLRDEGLVHVMQGAGVFVAGSIDTRPIVEQIIDLLHDAVLPVGSLFPSEAELCKELGISRNRLRPALHHLEGRGLIGTVGGRGRVVLAHPRLED